MKLDHPEKKGLSGVTVTVLVICAILVVGVVAGSVLKNSNKDTGSTAVAESTETTVDSTKEEKETGTETPSSTEVETVSTDGIPVVESVGESKVEVLVEAPLEVVETKEPVIVEEVVSPVEVEVAPVEASVEAESGIVTVEDAPEEAELPEEVAVKPESETGSVEETGSADEEVAESEKSPLLYVSQTAPVNVHVEKPLTKEVDWNGYSMTVDAYTGHAVVSYPSIVTDDDVYAFAAYAWENYSDYLNGVDITILGDGKAEITYPDNYGEEEFDLAISTLEEELPLYIAEVLSEETPAKEPDETVPPVIEEAIATVVDEPADEESVVAVEDDSEEVVLEEEKPAPIEDSSVSSGNSPVEVMEKKTEEQPVNDLVKRTTVAVWGSPYGFGEIVGDGASFNFRRFVRSYVYSFNVEYDWRVNSLFNIGMKAGYDGVIHHVEGYVNQAPVMLTAGVIPFETDHSVISLDFGFGVDVVSCAVNKTFAPVLDLSFAYGFKLGDLSLNLGLGVMGEYTMSTREYRVEFNPLKLGLGYTF